MPLDPRDHQLSMRISPRARRQEDNRALRSLLVHRLTDGWKAVWRRSLADERRASLYCERCEEWFPHKAFPVEWQCPSCEQWFRVEFAAYEAVEDID